MVELAIGLAILFTLAGIAIWPLITYRNERNTSERNSASKTDKDDWR